MSFTDNKVIFNIPNSIGNISPILWTQNASETGQQNSRLSTTATEETMLLGNTIFHNSIPLHFSALAVSKHLQHKQYFPQQQCNIFQIKPEASNDSRQQS